MDFVETDNVSRHRISMRYWRLRRNSKILTKHFGIGCRAHMLLGLIDKINQYDVVIGTTDSIGLGLCYLKRCGLIKVNIIFLNMGLGSGIAMRDHDKTAAHRSIVEEVVALLGYCKNLVSLGKPEHQYLLALAPQLKAKLVFLPFGIDTRFWHPQETSRIGKIGTVLSVGNDRNRDWDMALKVASICPEVHFKFLTRRLKHRQCPPNVELIVGDIKGMSVSDVAVRTLYQESDLVIIPLRQTLQPSGQSVALQSLACGTAVLISKTKGLWDPSRFIDGETIDLVELGSPESFKAKIDLSLSCSARSLEIAKKGRALVSQEYSVEIFAEHLQEICSH